jgi:cobalt-zinc-cadmium efflux system membrane fusion protein
MKRTSLLVPVLVLILGVGSACGRRPAETKAEKADAHGERAEPAGDDHAAEEHHEEMPGTVRLTSAAIAEANIAIWKVAPVPLEHLLMVPGDVGYDENRLLTVSSSVRGRVASIPVDLGQRVEKGAVLLRIESVDLGKAREEFLKAVAELRVAEKSYERAKRLVSEKAISPAEFQGREATYLSSVAARDAAAGALRQAGESEEGIAAVASGSGRQTGVATVDLRAPFAGEVIDRKVTPGSLVESFQPLLVLADTRNLWVFFRVYEKDLSLVHTRLPVAIVPDAYPDERFSGSIDFVGGDVDASTRAIRIRAVVANPGGKLKPGMFVKGQIEVPRPASEAGGTPAVPQSALQTLEGRSTIFVRTGPETFARRFVETGHTFEGFTEILSGVKPGEEVVTEGSFILKSEFAKAMLADDHH